MSIRYVKGDATSPQGTGNAVITHVCNNLGKWGKGFVLAISQKWKKPESQYKDWFKAQVKPRLGEVQFVEVSRTLTIANIIGQDGIRNSRRPIDPAPVRYEAIHVGLSQVATYALDHSASVHMPRIGCGLAGGTWEEIEPIITECLVSKGIDVFVYDL